MLIGATSLDYLDLGESGPAPMLPPARSLPGTPGDGAATAARGPERAGSGRPASAGSAGSGAAE